MSRTKIMAVVNNAPEILHTNYYTLAKVDQGQLWFYGQYATRERALEVTKELGANCVILQNEDDTSDDGK